MNALEKNMPLAAAPVVDNALPLYRIALLPLVDPSSTGREAEWLRAADGRANAAALFEEWQRAPPEEDRRLHALCGAFDLAPIECMAVALASAAECDPMLGRALAWLQNPAAATRPSVGLLLALAGAWSLSAARSLALLVEGPARACGLLSVDDPARALPEQVLRVALPTVLALRTGASDWPGVRLEACAAPHPVASLHDAADRQASALRAGLPGPGPRALAVRSGDPRDAQRAAALLAHRLGRVAAFIEGEPQPGMTPWLCLQNALPVLCCELAPGETRRLPVLPGFAGPLLLACGLDGSFVHEGCPVASWRVPLPLPSERAAMWQNHVEASLAEHIGRSYRTGPAQIDALARAAQHAAQLESAATSLGERHIRAAARRGGGSELGSLAQQVDDDVSEAAFVMPPDLRNAMQALLGRCTRREGLADALGPSAQARYRPGVRALFVGASGTGKTLGAAWLATRLGLPMFRVDLSAVASKYIGETEKNLSLLFARAEHRDVVLLFDEADALFGKRTDVKDANDRYANQQTNYLLQRIESFDGIAVLTSNSRSRFDSAFTRRLDAIVEFTAPGPQERRALWLAHLGPQHLLDVAQVNRIAAACDLSGGHIRNATLAAASAASGPIAYAPLCAAIAAEYAKLGRHAPAGM